MRNACRQHGGDGHGTTAARRVAPISHCCVLLRFAVSLQPGLPLGSLAVGRSCGAGGTCPAVLFVPNKPCCVDLQAVCKLFRCTAEVGRELQLEEEAEGVVVQAEHRGDASCQRCPLHSSREVVVMLWPCGCCGWSEPAFRASLRAVLVSRAELRECGQSGCGARSAAACRQCSVGSAVSAGPCWQVVLQDSPASSAIPIRSPCR